MNIFGLGKSDAEKLYGAIRKGNVSLVEKVLSKTSVMFDGVDSVGENALRLAVECRNLKIVQMLLVASVNVRGDYVSGETTLCRAAEKGYGEIVEYLLSVGVGVFAVDKAGNVPLVLAAAAGHLDVMQKLVNAGADVNYITKSSGGCAISSAAYNGHIDCVKYLIEKRANICNRTIDVMDPLIWAARGGHVEIVQLLINAKVKVNAKVTTKQDSGFTALHYAAMHGYTQIVEILLNAGADPEARKAETYDRPHLTTDMSKEQMTKLVLENSRMNACAKTTSKSTPLILAVDNGYKDIVIALLNAGANVNAESATINMRYSKTCMPLHIAVSKGFGEIVDILIKNGADINADSYPKSTPLIIAIDNGYKDIVVALLKAGADVNVTLKAGFDLSVRPNNYIGGWTPLHLAACKGFGEMVDVLIKNGANVNAIAYYKDTPLHVANGEGYRGVVIALIKAGANVNALNSTGESVFYLLWKKDILDSEIITLLENAGLSPYIFYSKDSGKSLPIKTPVGAKGWLHELVAHLIRVRNAEIAAERRRRSEHFGNCFVCGSKNVKLVQNLDGLWICNWCFLNVDDDESPL